MGTKRENSLSAATGKRGGCPRFLRIKRKEDQRGGKASLVGRPPAKKRGEWAMHLSSAKKWREAYFAAKTL